MTTTFNEAHDISPRHHSLFWFNDGSLIVETEEGIKYKLHGTLLSNLSPKFKTYINSGRWTYHDLQEEMNLPKAILSPPIDDVRLPGKQKVSYLQPFGFILQDFEVLLEHIYHLKPMTPDTPFHTLSRILRITHSSACHFPTIFDIAKGYLERTYPAEPRLAHYGHWQHIHEATLLCIKLNIRKPLKPLFYALITTSEFDIEESSEDRPIEPIPSHSSNIGELTDTQLTVGITKRCIRGMHQTMQHFTPILFTPPATSHMECTDKLAELWMPLVLQPAITNGGVYKPLETLDAMSKIQWSSVGICELCRQEKEKEWQDEADTIWNQFDTWLGL